MEYTQLLYLLVFCLHSVSLFSKDGERWHQLQFSYTAAALGAGAHGKDAARNVNSKVMPEDVATVSRRLGVDLNDSDNLAGLPSRIRNLISSVSGKGLGRGRK